MREPTYEVTPDGIYVFEVEREDGTRVVATVFPEDIDEVAGPPTPGGTDLEERRRRLNVARLLAEPELREQIGQP
ncbi:MAG: hypothetical protein ACJ79S_14455 [Gemmatimonadaceae bacterium]